MIGRYSSRPARQSRAKAILPPRGKLAPKSGFDGGRSAAVIGFATSGLNARGRGASGSGSESGKTDARAPRSPSPSPGWAAALLPTSSRQTAANARPAIFDDGRRRALGPRSARIIEGPDISG